MRMVKKPDNSSSSTSKSSKIELETSNNDSEFNEDSYNEYQTENKSTSKNKENKKNQIEQSKRQQIVKKRLNNVNTKVILNKYKLETAVYMEKNQELALELEKQKQLTQIKELEILDLKRDQFELKEYIIQLERELENYKRYSKNNINHSHDLNIIDFKVISDLCKEITEKANIIEKSMSTYVQPSTARNSNICNNTTISRASTATVNNENSKLGVSAFEVHVESIAKMQQLAVENSMKLQQRREELEVKEKPDVYDFDENDEENKKLEEELQRLQQQINCENVMECDDNHILGVIQEEDEEINNSNNNDNENKNEEVEEEDEEEDNNNNEEENEDEEEGENVNELEYDDDEFANENDEEEVEEEEDVVENSVINETELEDEKSFNESEDKDDWITNNNVKKKIQTYENKVKKHVTFEFVNTPPRKITQNDSIPIYNDENIDHDNKKPINKNDDKPKRALTPKRVNKKSKISNEEDNLDKNNKKTDLEEAVEKVESKSKRPSISMKKSLDRRRSQVFNPIDSPNDGINKNEHRPHIQPTEIYQDKIEPIMENNKNDVEIKEPNKNDEVKKVNDNDKENQPQPQLLRRTNRSKSKLIPNDSLRDEDTSKIVVPVITSKVDIKPVADKELIFKPEFAKPPPPPPPPRKNASKKENKTPIVDVAINLISEPNPNETYVVENYDEEQKDNTKLLNKVANKLKNQEKSPMNNKILKEVQQQQQQQDLSFNEINENTDLLSLNNQENTSTSSSTKNHSYSNEKANTSSSSSTYQETLKSADSSMNNDENGDNSGRMKRAKKAVSYKERSLNTKMRRDGKNNVCIKMKD